MKTRSLLFPLLIAAALMSSCTQRVLDAYVSDKASLAVASKELPAEAGNAFVSVQTDGVWMLEIVEGADWASVSQTTGTGPKFCLHSSRLATTPSGFQNSRMFRMDS